jgi:tRNA threonylcarbamoyl adenosine modification protein YeaZ
MIVLAIDTSGPSCAVCLLRGGDGDGSTAMLAERAERIGRAQAERLVPMVEEALQSAHIAFAGLGRIAVATGPGSFTGIRVGVAAARGLALALGIDSVGIGSLEALAAEARHAIPQAPVVAVLAGPRGDVFAYAADANGATRLQPSLLDPAELARLVAGWGRSPLALIGSAAPVVADHLGRGGLDARIVREAEAPEAGWIARLALAETAIGPPRPLYLRPPDAKPQMGRAVARV